MSWVFMVEVTGIEPATCRQTSGDRSPRQVMSHLSVKRLFYLHGTPNFLEP